MKFKFSFERLLAYKKTAEEIAQRDWAEAQAKVDKAQLELKAMYTLIDESRARASEVQMAGGQTSTMLANVDAFINGQKIRIQHFRVSMRDLVMDAEQKHEALIEAAKEKKTLEKLKENQFEDFKLRRKKHELKEVDDLVITRFKREA